MILDVSLNELSYINISRKKQRGGSEKMEMELLYNDNKITAVIGTGQDSGTESQDLNEELPTEDRNFKEKFLDGNVVDEEHENNKDDNNGVVEDALEKTINEVAEV